MKLFDSLFFAITFLITDESKLWNKEFPNFGQWKYKQNNICTNTHVRYKRIFGLKRKRSERYDIMQSVIQIIDLSLYISDMLEH